MSSTDPLSGFVTFFDVSDSHLLSMISDSGLVLEGSSSPSDFLSVLCAKELAQATLAHVAAEAAAKTSRSSSVPPPTASAVTEDTTTIDPLHPVAACSAPSPHKR